jgi:hypothetical protein
MRRRDHSNVGLAASWQDTLTHALQQGVERADPDLAEVVHLAQQILVVERQPGGLLDPRTPSTFKISDLQRPMKAYLFLRKHPAVVYALPLGILALTFLVGRATAPKSRKEHS